MFLRHRSAKSVKSSASSLLSRLTPRRRSKVARAANYAVETLENRCLLTSITLHGGDNFTFINEDGNFQSVKAFGNITAQVIGAK